MCNNNNLIWLACVCAYPWSMSNEDGHCSSNDICSNSVVWIFGYTPHYIHSEWLNNNLKKIKPNKPKPEKKMKSLFGILQKKKGKSSLTALRPHHTSIEKWIDRLSSYIGTGNYLAIIIIITTITNREKKKILLLLGKTLKRILAHKNKIIFQPTRPNKVINKKNK